MKKLVDKSLIKIGWIGTGIMGRSMCEHIVSNGFQTFVYNRTKEKALGLINGGAKWVDSPDEVARRSDVIFTMVGFPDDVREVYLGERGILKGVRGGGITVDMTTTEPSLAKGIYEKAKAIGVSAIDAPVSGGDVGAREARLSIMVGGDKEAVDSVMPLLKLMGKNIVYQGEAGSGQHTKMCNQIVVAGNMIGLCESLLYCCKSGMNPYKMLESVSKGAANSWLLENLSPKIIERDFSPGFIVEHFIKDIEIAIREAEKMNLTLPGLSLVKDLYIKLKELSYGRSGTQALILALEHLSGGEIPEKSGFNFANHS